MASQLNTLGCDGMVTKAIFPKESTVNQYGPSQQGFSAGYRCSTRSPLQSVDIKWAASVVSDTVSLKQCKKAEIKINYSRDLWKWIILC